MILQNLFLIYMFVVIFIVASYFFLRPGYAISYNNCGLSIVVEIKITACRKKEDTVWEKEKGMSDLSYLQSKAEDWVQKVR